MDAIENTISEVAQQYNADFQQYTLKDVREISKDETEKAHGDFKQGAYGKVIDLDWAGTRCVGKVLHSIFFAPNTDCVGVRELLTNFFKEIKLLSGLKHPSIVQFLGLYYRNDSSLPVLVMEKMECSLTEYLSTHKKGSLREAKILRILLDVSRGLVYLHEEIGFAHRDLSSNNILLTVDMGAKIADFGSARILDKPGGWNLHARLTTQPGAVDFMPPESLLEKPDYDISVDVFSFGCVIIHVCTQTWPTPVPVPKGEFISEIDRRQKYLSEMGDSFFLPMVRQCLEELRNDRPTSREIMSLLQARAAEIEIELNNITEQADYTIVFAGITGAGKSTAGNYFLNKKAFSSKGGVLRGSKICSASTATICGKTVKIIDTPGFFDGFKSTEDNFNELSKVLTLAKDGIHAVAFVMGRYTTSCEEAIKQLLLFKGVQPFVFVLLTHAEDEGIDKTTTDKYIEECLSSPDCPPGFRNLMDMVENRVIMLESVGFVANDYRERKCEELMIMAANVFTINGNRVYTNVMLEHTAQIYEKAKLQQEIEILETTQLLELNTEKVTQLKQQTDDTSEEITALEKENEILKNKLEEIKDEQYLEQLTSKILKDEMIKSNIKSNSISDFVGLFAAYVTMSAIVTPTLATPCAVIGGGLGAVVGSVIPGVGTGAGAYAGAQAGGIIGGVFSFGATTASMAAIAYDNCKNQ